MIEIKVPSKTFLCGEYVALNGGPALVLNTGPEFLMSITKGASEYSVFQQGSPCDQFFQDNLALLKDLNFDFKDPHAGRGGFGASGAKFNSLVAVEKLLQGKPLFNSLDFREKLLHYSRQQQSGYDVISQFNGEICFIDLNDKKIERLSWPFEDKFIYVVRTGNKLNTHEHLANLQVTTYPILTRIATQAYDSLKNIQFNEFSEHINAYYNQLRALNLICTETLQLTDKIKQQTQMFSAVKGCGAAGSDTLLLLADQSNDLSAKKLFSDLGLELVFSGNKLCEGMSLTGSLGKEAVMNA